eukprot:TRINITY_DN6239_c0_g1_i1.p1 TRINITY_DN6239_c0_g1~~TRINITY_DN6239_c0_g1_i1.p1  ORF type:complete len:226 (-),score=52.00 TRINITY_DN6239_c0_g1_i1:245-922(-)
MCIRDRYQRRVHGEYQEIGKYIKSLKLNQILMKTLIIMSIVCAITASQTIHPQKVDLENLPNEFLSEFMRGLILSQKGRVSEECIMRVKAEPFKVRYFKYLAKYLGEQGPYSLQYAIDELNDLINALGKRIPKGGLADYCFYLKEVIREGEKAFEYFSRFQQKAAYLLSRTGLIPQKELTKMLDQLSSGDYVGAGWTLGNLITQLNVQPPPPPPREWIIPYYRGN